MVQKLLMDSLPWYPSRPAVPTVNAECVTYNFVLFNVVHQLIWFCWFSTLSLVFCFRHRRFVLNDPDGISINLGFIFRALLPFSGIMKLADFLQRAMMVSSAVGEVFTLAWTHSLQAHLLLPRLVCTGFLQLLGGSPRTCCVLQVISLVSGSPVSRQCFLGTFAFASAGFLCVPSDRLVFVVTFSFDCATLRYTVGHSLYGSVRSREH